MIFPVHIGGGRGSKARPMSHVTHRPPMDGLPAWASLILEHTMCNSPETQAGF